jgi:hypothetical protein
MVRPAPFSTAMSLDFERLLPKREILQVIGNMHVSSTVSHPFLFLQFIVSLSNYGMYVIGLEDVYLGRNSPSCGSNPTLDGWSYYKSSKGREVQC